MTRITPLLAVLLALTASACAAQDAKTVFAWAPGADTVETRAGRVAVTLAPGAKLVAAITIKPRITTLSSAAI